MNAENYIAELLQEHDCVIIPGFGGFIGNYLHARIHPVHHTFLPPSKSLLFNINLKQNDGLLASKIAQRENISYEKAMQDIREMVDWWLKQLEEQNYLILDLIGKLSRTSEGILQFEQDNNLNFLPGSFGLSSFVSPAIRRAGLQEKIEKKVTRYMSDPKENRRVLPKSLKWAAVLVLPIGMAAYFGFTNFNTAKNLRLDYSGWLFSTNTPSPVKNNPPAKIFVVRTPAISKEIKPAPVADTKVVPAETPSSTATQVSSSQPSEQPFAIIVGAFRIHENADHLVSELRQKGFDALVLDTTRTGLVRVSIGTYALRDQALQQLASLRSKDFSSAWLLAR